MPICILTMVCMLLRSCKHHLGPVWVEAQPEAILGPRVMMSGGVQEGAEGGEMVEKEAKRLEVLKRRQERELNQLVHYELMRKALQVPCPDATLIKRTREIG